MIDFKCDFQDNEGITRAKFSGDVNDLVAELCVQISLIYGGIIKSNPEAGIEFKNRLFMTLIDDETSGKIFSDELVNIILSADAEAYTVVIDHEEFKKQVQELENE